MEGGRQRANPVGSDPFGAGVKPGWSRRDGGAGQVARALRPSRGPAIGPVDDRRDREATAVARTPDDPQTPIARQGGGPVRTYLFIGVVVLGVLALLLIVFGWSGSGS